MKLTKLSLTFLTLTASLLLISGLLLRGAAQTTPSDHNASAGDDSTQVKIARAMSAGPRRGREGGKDRRHRRARQDGRTP